MRISVVFTDLDGTLLELAGEICSEARATVQQLNDAGIPVCALTSKTAYELMDLIPQLRLPTPAGFENGAGILFPGGSTQLFDRAVPAPALHEIATAIRNRTGAPLRTLDEIGDQELAQLTHLPFANLPAVRRRLATAPLLVAEEWDEALGQALPTDRGVCLVRGNRFLHLQGGHDKGTALLRLLTAVTRPPGVVIACGDSPNDIPMLEAAELPIIIPSSQGPHPVLLERFPGALVAPHPHGKGWAAALSNLL